MSQVTLNSSQDVGVVVHTKEEVQMSILPEEVLIKIFECLSDRNTVFTVYCINHRWRALATPVALNCNLLVINNLRDLFAEVIKVIKEMKQLENKTTILDNLIPKQDLLKAKMSLTIPSIAGSKYVYCEIRDLIAEGFTDFMDHVSEAEWEDFNKQLGKSFQEMTKASDLSDSMRLVSFKKSIQELVEGLSENDVVERMRLNNTVMETWFQLLKGGSTGLVLKMFNIYIKFISSSERIANEIAYQFLIQLVAFGYQLEGNSLQARLELKKIKGITDQTQENLLKYFDRIVLQRQINHHLIVHLMTQLAIIMPMSDLQQEVAAMVEHYVLSSQQLGKL